MNTKQLLTVCTLIFLTSFTSAQNRTSEFGIIAGSSYYMGDVNHSRLFYSPQLAYGLFYKRSLNDHNNARIQITKHSISGNDTDFPSGYQQDRMHSFSNDIYELGLQYEFNFFPYNLQKRLNLTSYITTGASVVLITAPEIKFSPSFPIGIGFKYGIGKRLTLGAEWTYKYAFTDELDLLPPNTQDPSLSPSENKQINNQSSNDWYSLAGIIISYNFASTKKWCPAYDRKK